jgi:outer membrane scaffolding protein for murein synthesis (MipA/OmpV family)
MTVAGSAAAQDQPKRTVTGQIGAIVLSVPAYPGSSERWILPAPIVDLRVAGRIYVGSGASGLSGGAGVVLFESPALSWTADFTLMPDRPEGRADALAGLGDRGLGGFAGTTLALRRGQLQLTASAAKGVERRMGAFAVLGLSSRMPLPSRWFAQVGGLAVFGDADYMMWDFGVTRAQAAQRGLLLASGDPRLDAQDTVPYRPDAGIREWRGTLAVGRGLTSRLTLSGTAALVRLQGDAARSPLTREATSWEAGAGLSWGF